MSPTAQRSILFGVFFLSGFTGLIYESLWSHYLKLFLGHAAYAQTLVLAIFMGGMALGAAAASMVGGRLRNPLAVYAFSRSREQLILR
jgi:predicted membrane-bound spermidine synthase